MSDVVGTLNQLINDVVSRAQIYGISYAEAYFDEMNDILTANGDVQSIYSEFVGVDQSQKNMRADGYSFETDDDQVASQLKEITIVATDYGYDGVSDNIIDVETFNTADLEKKFMEMKRFVSEVVLLTC